jgi:hypothetical protein
MNPSFCACIFWKFGCGGVYKPSDSLNGCFCVYISSPRAQKKFVKTIDMRTVSRVSENSTKTTFMSVDVSRKSVSKVCGVKNDEDKRVMSLCSCGRFESALRHE